MAETTFSEAREVAVLAGDLIEADHPHLQAAEIRWLFTGGKRTRVSVLAGRERYYASSELHDIDAGPDFSVEIARETWAGLSTQRARKAFVDERLEEMGRETNQKTQEYRWVVNKPTRVFPKNLARYGPHSPELRVVGRTFKALPTQLALDLGDEQAQAPSGNGETVDPEAPSRIHAAVSRERQ